MAADGKNAGRKGESGLLDRRCKEMAWSAIEKNSATKKGTGGKTVELHSADNENGGDTAKQGNRNLDGGMEILDVEFMLSIIENTKGDDKNDVKMRRLNFDELIRRKQLNAIDSKSLKVYAMDETELYGKDIQCAAMTELTIRTAETN